MKYVARPPQKNVNVSDQYPLIQFGQLLVVLLVGLTLLYFALGALVDFGVGYVPYELERKLGGKQVGSLLLGEPGEKFAKETKYLQKIVDELVRDLPNKADYPEDWFRVTVYPSEVENAFATLGGNLAITEGLLQAASSENEIAMVLGHEIGHIVSRDPLRGLGRGLFLVLFSSLLGSDVADSSLVSNTLVLGHQGYSRGQESEADKLGLRLLVDRYGHAFGATKFFERMDHKDGTSESLGSDILSSHPDSGKRIKALEKMIERQDIVEWV